LLAQAETFRNLSSQALTTELSALMVLISTMFERGQALQWSSLDLRRITQRAFSPVLRETFELIFVDSRHFIPSYQPSEEELQGFTLATFADDVEALRIHLGIDKWTVLGHSLQGQIALEYARRYPGHTSHLVLVAAVPYSMNEFGEIVDRFWEEEASVERKERHVANRSAMEGEIAAATASRRFVTNYIADAARWWADPTYDSTPLWEGVETGPAFGGLLGLLPSKAQARSTLEHLDMPTLLILGRLDYGIPHVVWEDLIVDLPNVSYVLLEEDSHNPQTESPERFDPELINWMLN
jgi:proline iminopeptidase